MPVVAMPDGTNVSFPDTMSAGQISTLIASKFPDAVKGLQAPASNPQSDLSVDNLVRSAAHGVPIVGGLADRFAAGMDALTEPLLGRGSQSDTLSQRYAENLANEQGHTKAFEQAHPIASTAAELAGGVGALGAAAKTATGARLLGLTGDTLPQQALNGALGGAALNATDAAVRGQNPIDALETGALLGGVAPVAGRAIGTAVRGITGGIGSLAEPFGQAGREARANRIISEFSQGGPTNVAQSGVQGSEPTLAQATANPGLAALERQLRNMPGEPNAAFTARDLSNSEAREGAFRDLSGDQQTLEALRGQRSQDAEEKLNQTFGPSPQVNPSGIVRVIDNILASKSGQRQAVKTALNGIRDQVVLPNPLEDRISQAATIIRQGLKNISPARVQPFKDAAKLLRQANNGDIEENDLVNGLSKLAKTQKIVGPIDNALSIIKQGPTKLQTDAEQLYGIRQNASDKMKFSGSAEKLASSELINVQNAIDRAIGKKTTDYLDYLRTYAEQSKPIDVQELLQSANVTDAGGKISLGKLDTFIKNVERTRGKAGANSAKSVTTEQLGKLKAIRDDLRMAQNSSLGKAIGSNTVQNLMTGGTLEGFLRNQAASIGSGGLLGYGLDLSTGHHAPGAGAIGGAVAGGLLRGRFNKADADVIDRVVQKMLNPQAGQAAISGTVSSQQAKALADTLARKRAANVASVLARGGLPAFAYGPPSSRQ